MFKRYYRLQLKLDSAMNIGSGDNYATDKDLLRNSKNEPFIPGTALAGIYRAMFLPDDQEKYFGPELDPSDYSKKLETSKMYIYDAQLTDNADYRISQRDCVALDDFKTGIKGAKFDFEILEPGVTFISLLEQNADDKDDQDIGLSIAQNIKNSSLFVGGKTRRGLGKLVLENVLSAEFDLSTETDLTNWLDFDMYDEADTNWTPVELDQSAADNDSVRILLSLNQKGGLSIRRYTTAVNTTSKPEPDYEQLCYSDDTPVIPGTSWAGVFRHHLKTLGISEAELNDIFGVVKQRNKKGTHASRICFSESIVSDTTKKMITRNAIDRFTASTIDGALYTERSRFGGNTTLAISFPKEASKAFKNAMAATIVDLHLGLVSVGGLTSVGRGIFEITTIKIQGIPITMGTPEELYSALTISFDNKEEK